MSKRITLVDEPFVTCIGAMQLQPEGLVEMTEWVKSRIPEAGVRNGHDLWGTGRDIHDEDASDNELLVELAGRKCYNSFGDKAGQKDNHSYCANLIGKPGRIPHASVFYHAKLSFFVANISRRVGLELIRHYVGADRDLEGSPSQESTRYTHHPGWFTVHPRHHDVKLFADGMQISYDHYLQYIEQEFAAHLEEYGKEAKGMARKRIYEAAAQFLPNAAETSLVWTSNPVALAKMFKERTNEASDLEFQRLARKWEKVAHAKAPALFRDSNRALQEVQHHLV